MASPGPGTPEPARLEPWGSGYDAQCAGKNAYPSESGALAALKHLQREGLFRTGSGVQPYQCRYCREWHLGHV